MQISSLRLYLFQITCAYIGEEKKKKRAIAYLHNSFRGTIPNPLKQYAYPGYSPKTLCDLIELGKMEVTLGNQRRLPSGDLGDGSWVSLVRVLHGFTTRERAVAIAVHCARKDCRLRDRPANAPWERATELLDAAESSLRMKLSPEETDVYRLLNSREQVAFRICRYLAVIRKHPDKPFGEFTLSACNLGLRLGVADVVASRILKRFIKRKLLRIVRPGQQRTKGVKAVATTFHWVPRVSSYKKY